MGPFSRNSSSAGAKQAQASDRDLRRLRRIDLLELLIDQIKENEEKAQKIDELNALIDHLKDRLDEKDVRIELLLKNVDVRDAQIESMTKRNQALAHSQGLLDAQEILEISDIAVDLYLTRISGGTVRSVSADASHEFAGAHAAELSAAQAQPAHDDAPAPRRLHATVGRLPVIQIPDASDSIELPVSAVAADSSDLAAAQVVQAAPCDVRAAQAAPAAAQVAEAAAPAATQGAQPEAETPVSQPAGPAEGPVRAAAAKQAPFAIGSLVNFSYDGGSF